ncbi:YdcH family protein [Yoonia sp.]|uniref:YdcH family protein n=1 Tax=Yoonia sp. TaxID=2212373 RepID=UPI0023B3C12F
MAHTPHQLPEEFPEHADTMLRLKETDAHFEKLSEDYHVLNSAIHRAETDLEPTDDLHMAQMRKERLALKDQISAILNRAQSS